MNQQNAPRRPAPAKTRQPKQSGSKPKIVSWLSQHLMLVLVVGLAVLVLIVILIARSGGEEGQPVRPDSSGPIQVGELELNIHQWNCGLTAFDRVSDPDADPIQAADGNHFCTLAVQVTNLNTEKLRAFDPAGQRIVFGDQEYVYHPIATRDGLGARSDVRILDPGAGVDPGTVPPLVTMVFEIPQDSELAWRTDSVLLLTAGSDQEEVVEIPLKDYDKQS